MLLIIAKILFITKKYNKKINKYNKNNNIKKRHLSKDRYLK